MIEKWPLAILVEDYSLYPRGRLDELNVLRLLESLQAGVTLPPIVADRETKKIIDGWHRKHALERYLGHQGVVDVDVRNYQDASEMLEAIAQLNVTHGLPLSRKDVVRCLVLAEQLHMPLSRMAKALNITTQRAETLRVRLAKAPREMPGTVPGTVRVVVKDSFKHLQGSDLTEEQVEASRLAPGVSYSLLVRQLLGGLRSDLMNLGDPQLIVLLRQLRDELEQRLP
jgi:hypothetical protein